ncbi:MAG: hypothetical protein ACRD5L_13935 [Bryobacteraceae bacterium]
MRFISIAGGLALAGAALIAPASAETLELECKTPDSSRAGHVTVDLENGLVLNGMGGSGRRWAANLTDASIVWDEVYSSRNGHTADHYVLERSSGTLRRTDMARGQPAPETLTALCQKAS